MSAVSLRNSEFWLRREVSSGYRTFISSTQALIFVLRRAKGVRRLPGRDSSKLESTRTIKRGGQLQTRPHAPAPSHRASFERASGVHGGRNGPETRTAPLHEGQARGRPTPKIVGLRVPPEAEKGRLGGLGGALLCLAGVVLPRRAGRQGLTWCTANAFAASLPRCRARCPTQPGKPAQALYHRRQMRAEKLQALPHRSCATRIKRKMCVAQGLRHGYSTTRHDLSSPLL